MRKNVFAGSMLLLACVALVACTTDSGEEVQYVKIGQNLCSFLAEGNQPLEIDVKASPAEWTVEMGASWGKAERTDDRTLTVTVDDNDTGAERSAVVTITAGQAVEEITVYQFPKEGVFARYRKLDMFGKRGAMSPNGRFVGGYAASVAPDDSWQYSPVITDLETGEVYEFGPYPEAIHFLTQTMCISDHGVLFIKDGYNGGTVAFDTEGNITEPRSPEGYKGKPTIEATSSDGKYWVGYANDDILSEGGLTRPLLWTDGIPAELPFPDKNFRNEDFRVGIMARGISANGEIIYGTSWENSDFGMLYWKNDGANIEKPQWVGKDVRETATVRMSNNGIEYDYTCVNGIICQAWNTQVSPSGKWIAGRYRKEFDPETKQRVDEPEYAAFYNTETETTVIVDDYGESGGRFVTDDGIGFIGIGTLAVSEGKVYDLNTGTDLGSTQDWIYDNYGIVIPAGYVNYISADGKYVFGTALHESALGKSFLSWYVAPPLEK